MLSISQRVSGGKSLTPESLLLTIVCMVQRVLVIFIIFLFCTLGVFFHCLFHTSHVISSTTRVLSAACPHQPHEASKQAQLCNLRIAHLLVLWSSFEGCLSLQKLVRTMVAMVDASQKVSAIPFRSPGLPQSLMPH